MGREEGSGWGTHVYLWRIHFDIWQNQYDIVQLNKIKFKKNNTHTQHYKATVGGGLVTQSCLTLATPWTVACQAPLSMRFPMQA